MTTRCRQCKALCKTLFLVILVASVSGTGFPLVALLDPGEQLQLSNNTLAFRGTQAAHAEEAVERNSAARCRPMSFHGRQVDRVVKGRDINRIIQNALNGSAEVKRAASENLREILASKFLEYRVEGRLSVKYDELTEDGARSRGMVFVFDGRTVYSPTPGYVIYADDFRVHGHLVIISVGAGYHAVLANLSDVEVKRGQFVHGQEKIGSIKPGPKGDKNVLYLELRHKGQPVDPEKYIRFTYC